MTTPRRAVVGAIAAAPTLAVAAVLPALAAPADPVLDLIARWHAAEVRSMRATKPWVKSGISVRPPRGGASTN